MTQSREWKLYYERTRTDPIYISDNLFIVNKKIWCYQTMKESSPSSRPYHDAKSHALDYPRGNLNLSDKYFKTWYCLRIILSFESMLSCLAKRYAFEATFDVSSNESRLGQHWMYSRSQNTKAQNICMYFKIADSIKFCILMKMISFAFLYIENTFLFGILMFFVT